MNCPFCRSGKTEAQEDDRVECRSCGREFSSTRAAKDSSMQVTKNSIEAHRASMHAYRQTAEHDLHGEAAFHAGRALRMAGLATREGPEQSQRHKDAAISHRNAALVHSELGEGALASHHDLAAEAHLKC